MRKLKHNLKIAFAIAWLIGAAVTYILTFNILIDGI